MVLRVTQFGEPVLRESGEAVTAFNDELRQFASDMIETMRAEDGIGLAAQQVGVALQFFVMDVQVREGPVDFQYTLDGRTVPLEMFMPLAVANPKVETSGAVAPYEEGCLSFPGIRGSVERPTQVTMHYQDLDGHAHVIACDGIFARVILHEYDHLQGTLFIDRMSPRVLRPLDSKLKRLKRDTKARMKSAC